MQRRKFLIGAGSLAAGGAAALGSGAFSRVESQRQVSIEVATDANAYLGMKLLDTPNSNNYVDYDENGHLYIDIGEHDDFEASGNAAPGEGVNSDSFTYFDGMFELCNQGKADIEALSYELPEGVPENGFTEQQDPRAGDTDGFNGVPTVAFYFKRDDGTRVVLEPGQETSLDLGTCVEIGVRTATKGVDATEDGDGPLIDGEVVITADAPGAGQPQQS